MKLNKNKHTMLYVLADFFMAALAWGTLFVFRKYYNNINVDELWQTILNDRKFYYGIILLPLSWVIFYALLGFYRKIYRRSRLREFGQTVTQTIVGVTIIFFAFILDDDVVYYTYYYKSYLFLLFAHFFLTYGARFLITSITVNKVHKGKIGFNTLIVGNNGNALEIYNDITSQEQNAGNIFVGYIKIDEIKDDSLKNIIPCLGGLNDIGNIITDYSVEELIIAVEPSKHQIIAMIISQLEYNSVDIKIVPDDKDILTGSVRMNNVLHTPLIMVSMDLMPHWQRLLKRLSDVVISSIFLLVASPVYLFTAIMVRHSSKGPIIYSQERIGIGGKPFVMHKFRSMYVDAEKNGPALSNKDDSRITPWGKIMRKYRLDELPQFYNVLIGNMSLVGPRPERKHFIDQIVSRVPYYKLLHRVKPGITSLGQVKYGYAENVDQMLERLKYDLLYIENMSLAMDVKILLYTVLIVFQGRGK